jgi:hypothetical protein
MDGCGKEIAAVGFGLRGYLRAHNAACARPIVHHGRGRPELAQRLGRQPGDRVYRTSGRKRHNKIDGMLIRPFSRPGTRHYWPNTRRTKRPQARHETAALTKFHNCLQNCLFYLRAVRRLRRRLVFSLLILSLGLPLWISLTPSFLYPTSAAFQHLSSTLARQGFAAQKGAYPILNSLIAPGNLPCLPYRQAMRPARAGRKKRHLITLPRRGRPLMIGALCNARHPRTVHRR